MWDFKQCYDDYGGLLLKRSCVKQSLRLHSQYSVSHLDYSNLEEQGGRNAPRVFIKIKYLSVSGTQLTHTTRENWNLKKNDGVFKS